MKRDPNGVPAHELRESKHEPLPFGGLAHESMDLDKNMTGSNQKSLSSTTLANQEGVEKKMGWGVGVWFPFGCRCCCGW